MPADVPLEVVGCQTGAERYEALAERVTAAGGRWSTVECFDRCEICEKSLIARVDGALMRFRSVDELVEAVTMLVAE
jgi:hypothetical protein